MQRVAFHLDGEEVHGLLLSAPNAIGICKVQRAHGVPVVYYRHVNRLRALTPEATVMLSMPRDRFVTTARVVEGEGPPEIDGWTIEDVVLFREYLAARYHEMTGRHGKRAVRMQQVLAAQLRYVKTWLKESRMRKVAAEGGLTDEERRDATALLRRVLALAWAMHRESRTMTREEVRMCQSANDFLQHYAPALATPSKPGGTP